MSRLAFKLGPIDPKLEGDDLVTLQSPASICVAWEVLSLPASTSNLRAWGAALGIAWGDGNRWRPAGQFSESGYSVARWGQVVVDAMFARGATLTEIKAAGEEALRLCRAVTGAGAVKAAEGFSAGEPAPAPGRS